MSTNNSLLSSAQSLYAELIIEKAIIKTFSLQSEAIIDWIVKGTIVNRFKSKHKFGKERTQVLNNRCRTKFNVCLFEIVKTNGRLTYLLAIAIEFFANCFLN